MSDAAVAEQMEAARKLLMEVVQEMYEENNRIPGVKRVRDATGLSLSEAKELLEESKPFLKKPKVTEDQHEQTPSVQPEGEHVKHESEPAEREIGKTKVEKAPSQASFSPEQPDNQEGLSPEGAPRQSENESPQPTDLDSLSEKGKLETQRPPWMWTSCFCR